MTSSISAAFTKVLENRYIVLVGWMVMAVVVTAHRIDHQAYNNFLLFKYSFHHALSGWNLYREYPECCFDSHHYGPLFSLIIAPFALLPLVPGMYLWQLTIVLVFFAAIHQLPVSTSKRNLICLICTQELYVSLREFQTNPAIAAMVMMTWVLIENKKDFWAALFIVLGFYVKLYGIVGLAFFFFSRNKELFLKSFIFWLGALFLVPMIVFSPGFILDSYGDWYHSLVTKNSSNVSITNVFQDVSVMGMIRKVLGEASIPNLPILLGGLLLFGLPYLRVDRFKELPFRLSLLASVLLFTVLFSTGSELSTYSIAFAGVGIWFVSGTWPKPARFWLLLLGVMYLGSLFDTDLSTYHFRARVMKPYALKALPCFILWLTIIYDLFCSRPMRPQPHTQPFISRLFNYEG